MVIRGIIYKSVKNSFRNLTKLLINDLNQYTLRARWFKTLAMLELEQKLMRTRTLN